MPKILLETKSGGPLKLKHTVKTCWTFLVKCRNLVCKLLTMTMMSIDQEPNPGISICENCPPLYFWPKFLALILWNVVTQKNTSFIIMSSRMSATWPFMLQMLQNVLHTDKCCTKKVALSWWHGTYDLTLGHHAHSATYETRLKIFV